MHFDGDDPLRSSSKGSGKRAKGMSVAGASVLAGVPADVRARFELAGHNYTVSAFFVIFRVKHATTKQQQKHTRKGEISMGFYKTQICKYSDDKMIVKDILVQLGFK